MDKPRAIAGATVFHVSADLDPEWGGRVARVLKRSGMKPEEFISLAVIQSVKSLEKSLNQTTRTPEVIPDETTTKKEGEEAQAGKERLASAQDKAAKSESSSKPRPRRKPKTDGPGKGKVGWPKGKPRGKRVKPKESWNIFDGFVERFDRGPFHGYFQSITVDFNFKMIETQVFLLGIKNQFS